MTEVKPIPTAYCRACGYLLRGLASTGACPECGRAFDLADAKTWTRRPRALRVWRSLRWPLAMVLLLVLACASGIGLLYWGWRQEQPAIRWARMNSPLPDFSPASPLENVEVRHIGPPWLKERAGRWGWLLGRAHVLYVTLDESPEAQEVPRRLRWLSTVWVDGPGLTGDWIAELAEGNELEQLSLDSEAVNDAFVMRLGQQKTLRNLRFSPATRVTDDGLAALSGFPELQELILDHTQIKGPGLQYLRHVPKLDSLSLAGTMVGDEAIPAVGECAELEYLFLRGTRVTSRGVGELAGLTKLKFLDLSETQVDDSVVGTMANMASLKTVYFYGNPRLSKDDLNRLRAALPAAEIDAGTE